MKKIYYIIIPLTLALTACWNKTPSVVEGTVMGEEGLETINVFQALYGAVAGHYYLIEGGGEETFRLILIARNGEDPLNVGDSGTFQLGEKYFNSTTEEYIDGELKTYRVPGYKLEGYLLD